MTTERWPHFASEPDVQVQLMRWCGDELAAWRDAVAAHAALPTMNARLAHRVALQEAFDALMLAYVCAVGNQREVLTAS